MNYLRKKRDAMLNSAKKSRLPSGYQEVEWIEGKGTQWIDSGVVANQKTNLLIKISANEKTMAADNIAGARVAGNDQKRFGIITYSSTNRYGFFYGDYSYQTTTQIEQNVVHEFEISKESFKVDKTIVNIPPSKTFQLPNDHRIKLFGFKSTGAYDKINGYKLYECTIKENNILVRNFVPCYRKSDTKIGLYDLVGQNFYTNSGSGNFTKGADV